MNGQDTQVAAAASHLTRLATETLFRTKRRFLGIFEPRLDAKADGAIAIAAERYVHSFLEHYGSLNLLGYSDPVPLSSLYTPMQVWEVSEEAALKEASRAKDSIVSSQPYEDAFGIHLPNAVKIPAWQSVSHHRHLLLVGSPGSGKTTFLRHVGTEILTGKKLGEQWQRSYFPIVLEPQTWTAPFISLEQAIAQCLRQFRFPSWAKLVRGLMDQGQLMILIDGANYLPEGWLSAFVEEYPRNRLLLSSRPGRAIEQWQQIRTVFLAEFDTQQMQEMTHRWFHLPIAQQQSDRRFWEALADPTHVGARQLARSPLWLTLLCSTYDRRCILPETPATLYQQALDMALATVDEQSPLVASWLAQVAFDCLTTDRFSFAETELASAAGGQENSQNPSARSGWLAAHAPKVSVEAIARSSKLFVPQGDRQWSFFHLTLQEYLSARFLYDHPALETAIEECITSYRWQEVFLFLAGLTPSIANRLLLLMERLALGCIRGDRLMALFQWADAATERQSSYLKPAARRAAALFLVLGIHHILLDFDRGAIAAPELANLLQQLGDRQPYFFQAVQFMKILDLDLVGVFGRAQAFVKELTFNLIVARGEPLEIEEPAKRLTRNLARKLASDRARRLSVNIHSILHRSSNLALPKERDLAFAIILARQLDAVGVFRDSLPLFAWLEDLQREVPNNNEPPEVHARFYQRFLKGMLEALGVSSELLQLSEAELQHLDRYFYICWLMVRCRQEAVDMDPSLWQSLETRLAQMAA